MPKPMLEYQNSLVLSRPRSNAGYGKLNVGTSFHVDVRSGAAILAGWKMHMQEWLRHWSCSMVYLRRICWGSIKYKPN
jgi:hypothetical protein